MIKITTEQTIALATELEILLRLRHLLPDEGIKFTESKAFLDMLTKKIEANKCFVADTIAKQYKEDAIADRLRRRYLEKKAENEQR